MAEIIIRKKKKRTGVPIGTMPAKIPVSFKMVLFSDFSSPAVGKNVYCEMSKNGGDFLVPANQPREVEDGWYKILININDLRSDVLILKFTASDCTQNDYVFFKGILRV